MADKFGIAVIYLAEAAIAWLYFERLFARRHNLAVSIIILAAGYSLLFGIALAEIPVPDALIFFAVNAALLCIAFDCGLKATILHSAFLTLTMFGSEVLVALVIGLFGQEFAEFTHHPSVAPALDGMSNLLYLMLSFIVARFFAPYKETVEEPKMIALFLGLSIISMLTSVLIVYLGSYSGLTGTTETMIARNILALLVVNLLFLVLAGHIRRTNTRSAPAPSPRSEPEDTGYYKELEEQYNSQRRLVHDIRNHLYAIEGLAVEGNATEVVSYISELEGGLTPQSPVRLTSDPVLNAILVRFRKDCRDKDVTFVLDLRDGGAAFIDAPDMTTLYGNLLSNAIEAAEHSVERSVELSVVHNAAQGVLMVSVNNSCDEPPIRDASGRMLSRKRGGRTPGVGLKNIERVVQKYRGVETMHYDADDRRFRHIIQFPVTQ